MKSILTGFALLLSVFCLRAALNLNVTWNPVPVSESNLLYRVYVSTNNGPFIIAATSVTPSMTFQNVAYGLYCVSITASNVWGEQPIKSIPGCALGPVTVPSVVTGVNVLLQNSP